MPGSYTPSAATRARDRLALAVRTGASPDTIAEARAALAEAKIALAIEAAADQLGPRQRDRLALLLINGGQPEQAARMLNGGAT